MTFSLPNVKDEQIIALESYQDKKGVVVVFSCNHCPYVIACEDRMNAIHNTYAPQGVPLIAISSNDIIRYPQDAPAQMKVRAEEKGFEFPYLFDESQEVAKAFGAEKTPHVFLMTYQEDQWRLLYRGAIDDNWRYPKKVKETYLADCIEALLKEERLPYEETPAVGCTIKWKG